MAASYLHILVNGLELSKGRSSSANLSLYVALNQTLVDVISISNSTTRVTLPLSRPDDHIQIFVKNLKKNTVVGSISFRAK